MTGKICGTGAYIPEKILDNEALSKLVDTSDVDPKPHGDPKAAHRRRKRNRGFHGG